MSQNASAKPQSLSREPLVYNVEAEFAGTEYSQALTPNTKSFLIRCRGDAVLKIAFQSGETSTNYITISKGSTYKQENLTFTGTLYFQSSKAAQVIEILEWS
jgi:hypothetical protein